MSNVDAQGKAHLLRRAFATPPGPWEWLLEGLTWLGLLATWGVLLIAWPHLPERIPTHFGLSGEPDAYGPRSSLFSLVGVQLAMWLGMTLLMRFAPHRLNVPMEVTEANAHRVAVSMRATMRGLKAFVVFLFASLVVQVVLIAAGLRSQLPGWFLILGLVVPPVIIGAGLVYGSSATDPAPGRGSGEGERPAASRRQPASGGRRLVWGLVLLATLTAASAIPLWAVPRWGVMPEQAVALATGAAMIAAGLIMPFLPPNPLAGIRTRWTLASERVWHETHRSSTVIWVPGGVLLVTFGLLNWRPLAAVLVVLAVVCGLSVLVSYRTARRVGGAR